MTDIRVERDVKFVHTLPISAADLVRASGDLYGRRTPSRLSNTLAVPDFYVKNQGYIFAYQHSRFFRDADGEPAINYPTYLEGTASYALSFYMTLDSEFQMIIPVECIETLDIIDRPGSDGEQEGWLRVDPLRYEVGSPTMCWLCAKDFMLDEDALVDNAFVCRECRD